MYPAEIVIPMKEELTENGFDELLTGSEVDEALKSEYYEELHYLREILK